MFAKLAIKNIKRSIKDYAIYFFTLVLGVAVFYVFNAIDSQSAMMEVTDRVRSILDLMNVVLGVVSVFVSMILGSLIIYASRFLIKRRGREFGIYLTLGMSKRKISQLLLIETFLIGLVSLAAGLVLGIAGSQLTSIVVANMFDADLTHFHFVFSFAAFVKTLIYFGIIYLIVMIFNTIIVRRQKLINLLSSNRRNEKVKLKNPWVCTVVFLVAATMLAWAYHLVTAGITFLTQFGDVEILLVPIVMGIVATFLLFWSLSGLLLRIFMSFKRTYYNKLNSFVLRQFSSKINTTVVSMSLICLMLFVTICVLGSALSINYNLHTTIERNMPVDIEVTSFGNNALDIEKVYERENIDLNYWLTDIVTYREYRVDDVRLSDTTTLVVGEASAVASDIADGHDVVETFVSQSDYNRAAKLFNLPALDLAPDQYAILADFQPAIDMRDTSLAAGRSIEILGHTLTPKFSECIYGTLSLDATTVNAGIFIVSDRINLPAGSYYSQETLLANYKSPVRARETDEVIERIHNRFFSAESDAELDGYTSSSPLYYYYVTTKQNIIDNNIGTSALVTFIGLYLGIIFLISSAAVLALKELSESSDNHDKYAILRKLGASNRMLDRALFWQIFIFFGFSLAIAVMHAVFGLMFCDFVLSTLGGIDIAHALPWVTGILIVIYGGYFMITYLCSRNIIREPRM